MATNKEPVTSDFGNQVLVTSASGVTFDLNKDYTKAMNAVEKDSAEYKQLKAERDAKIASKTYAGTQRDENGNSGYEDGSYGKEYNEYYTADKRNSVTDPFTSTRKTKETAAAPKYDTSAMKSYLDTWLNAAQKQQQATIDYATNQAVTELQRTKTDADATYQEQRDQIAIEEANAKDNQALYAEARGDKGGIGAAQYDSIMNTAARNRLAVNNAQTKLATDTARQMSDLRAQGEFKKADAMLNLTQQYLSQLMSLEQWAAEYNLSVAQFQAGLDQWAAEYEMSLADLLGEYRGTPTLSAQKFQTELDLQQQSMLASAAETLLAAGIMPSESQLAAIGMTRNQAQDYVTAVKLAAQGKGNGSGGDDPYESEFDKLYGMGYRTAERVKEYFLTKGYSVEESATLANNYLSLLEAGAFNVDGQKGRGTKYTSAWANVRKRMAEMQAEGKQDVEIISSIIGYLDTFDNEQLTDSGYAAILQHFGIAGYGGGN